MDCDGRPTAMEQWEIEGEQQLLAGFLSDNTWKLIRWGICTYMSFSLALASLHLKVLVCLVS